MKCGFWFNYSYKWKYLVVNQFNKCVFVRRLFWIDLLHVLSAYQIRQYQLCCDSVLSAK